MRTNHNASGKPSLEGCVGLRYPLRWVLQATYPWVCGILTDAKEYLKKNSKRIITRLVEEGDEDKIVQFLNLGFVSKPTLKSLIPKAEEKELTIVSSYILKQIGDKKTSNRFAL